MYSKICAYMINIKARVLVYKTFTLTPPGFGISMFLLHSGHGNLVLYFPLSTYRRRQFKQNEWRHERSLGSWNLSEHRLHLRDCLASAYLPVCFVAGVTELSLASLLVVWDFDITGLPSVVNSSRRKVCDTIMMTSWGEVHVLRVSINIYVLPV